MDFLNKKHTITRYIAEEKEWMCRVPWKQTNKLGFRDSPSESFCYVVKHEDHIRVYGSDDWRLHYDCFDPLENWMMTYDFWDNLRDRFDSKNFSVEPMGVYIKEKPLIELGYEVGDSLNMTYHPDTINNERYLKIGRKE